MAIRKPVLSVQEARRLSAARVEGPETTSLADAPQTEVALILEREVSREHGVMIDPVPVTAAPVSRPAYRRRGSAAKAPYVPPLASPAITSEMRVQVFVSAAYPGQGVSASFDALSGKYPAAKALQMILRRAMDEYEDRLADSSFVDLPETYPAAGQAMVQTSRIMPRELVDIARLHFDPLGFESSRAFGFKLATAALAAFFACERKRY